MTININIPGDLYQQATVIAESQRMSIDDVISSAFAEHVGALERLKQRATRGSREAFAALLDKVPDVEPEDYDRL